MQLRLLRRRFTPSSIIGELFVDGVFECYTLEPPIAENAALPGRRAMEHGTYRISLYLSPANRCVVPLLHDVPGQSYVEIHPGNWPKDTKACILVGTAHAPDEVLNSRAAFGTLMEKLNASFDRSDAVSIEIQTAVPEYASTEITKENYLPVIDDPTSGEAP